MTSEIKKKLIGKAYEENIDLNTIFIEIDNKYIPLHDWNKVKYEHIKLFIKYQINGINKHPKKVSSILDNGFLEFMYTMEHDWDMAVRYIESWEMNFTDEEMNQVREVYDRFKDYTETDWSAFANSQQND